MMIKIIYHELRKIEPSKARELVRAVLERQKGNVSKTARILGISRQTVRRARDGSLGDKSRRPHRIPRKTDTFLEKLIVEEAKRTGFRYRRLTSYLKRKYSVEISENTIKAILRRHNIEKRKKKSHTGKYRTLYDYEALLPFEKFQLDTKHLLDKKSLPKEVYEHMKKHKLPRYEWNIIDVGTRTRFTAYSYELSAVFGFMFIVFVSLWLRMHNVRNPIKIRIDNGTEFCAGSKKKLNQYNEQLKALGVRLETIPAGAKHLMAVVENSHRCDDEYFLMIHAERCKNKDVFLYKAQQWQDTWNYFRPSYGKGMNGLTPYEKFKKANTLINAHVFKFPVFLMEDILNRVGIFTKFLNSTGGKYVYTKCQNKFYHNILFLLPL